MVTPFVIETLQVRHGLEKYYPEITGNNRVYVSLGKGIVCLLVYVASCNNDTASRHLFSNKLLRILRRMCNIFIATILSIGDCWDSSLQVFLFVSGLVPRKDTNISLWYKSSLWVNQFSTENIIQYLVNQQNQQLKVCCNIHRSHSSQGKFFCNRYWPRRFTKRENNFLRSFTCRSTHKFFYIIDANAVDINCTFTEEKLHGWGRRGSSYQLEGVIRLSSEYTMADNQHHLYCSQNIFINKASLTTGTFLPIIST